MATDPETRRGIAQRALARARDQGVVLEDDSDFMALLEKWIIGEIPMRDMRVGYFSAVAQRERERLMQRRAKETENSDQDSQPVPPKANKKRGRR
jgi:hypothetical protein